MGYFHQTIWNNCYKSTKRYSGSSRRYTSGAKSAWNADFHPNVTRQENREVPQRCLEGRLAISRRYTSGAKPAWNGVFRPNVTHRENRRCYSGATDVPHGAGTESSQIVLGLMCHERPSRGGESQNGAKSRRFGMDMPCRAFYEG